MIPSTAAPARHDLLAIVAAAILLRVVCLIVMGLKAHDLANVPYRSDGSAYIDNAKRINGEGMPSEYDQRAFVGLPWVIAMGHRVGLPYVWGSQSLCWAIAGLMCAATAAWLRDARIGWAMAVLPPHFVLDTACVMNEPLMLLLCVLGMMTLRVQTWWGVAGAALLFACAGVVRPMACFAVLGAVALLLQARRPWRALIFAGATLGFIAVLLVTFKAVYWNPLDNAKAYSSSPLAYNGHLFDRPFGSFIWTARANGFWRGRYLYKLAYMVGGLLILAWGGHTWWRTRRPLDAWAVVWWGSNWAFATCVGSNWGVGIAQRSVMWAAPAGLWIIRGVLPVRWWARLAWGAVAVPWVFLATQG